MNIDLHTLDAGSLATYTEHAESLKDTAGFLLKIIPDTATDAFAKGDILQVLVFSVLFCAALSLLGAKAQRVTSLIDELSHVFFASWVSSSSSRRSACSVRLRSRPGPMASSRSSNSACWWSCLRKLLPVRLRRARRGDAAHRLQHLQLVRYLREELLIVLGTASSDAVLPQIMRKLEWMV